LSTTDGTDNQPRSKQASRQNLSPERFAGKRRYINRTITGTKKDAERWARENEFKRDLKRDQNPETWLTALTLTVNAFLDRWLATWKNSTRENSLCDSELNATICQT